MLVTMPDHDLNGDGIWGRRLLWLANADRGEVLRWQSSLLPHYLFPPPSIQGLFFHFFLFFSLLHFHFQHFSNPLVCSRRLLTLLQLVRRTCAIAPNFSAANAEGTLDSPYKP